MIKPILYLSIATVILNLYIFNASAHQISVVNKNNVKQNNAKQVETNEKLNSVCPVDMTLIKGEYCTEVRQICVQYLPEDIGSPYARCKRFAPATCVGKRVHKEFCIETFEHTVNGEELPQVNINFDEAKQSCENDGKRMCKETEWNFAQEGEQMFAYAVSNERPSDVCNFDNTHLGTMKHMLDLRKPKEELLNCSSSFGILSGPGNVDEWTVRDVSAGKYSGSLKGGWWGCLRNRVRPATTEHSNDYSASTVGTRCCKDI